MECVKCDRDWQGITLCPSCSIERDDYIAKLEKVVEAAEIYASMSDHAQYCGLTPFVPYEMVTGCTCGVDKLRAALAALKEGE